ncbi:protein FAM114A2 [Ceratitis capitata]|uniref:protein FAM114A2 n=1 Tax=Ceratitis capitata TaxID=7213 RepID=UPI000329E09C|nr:protein FAM114A2 [Ceratitis capitata]
MSTEIDGKIVNQAVNEASGWDQDDDDNWDDWGDAEENFDNSEITKLKDISHKKNETNTQNNNFNKIQKTIVGTNQDPNSNSDISSEPKDVQSPNSVASQKQATGWGGLFGGVVSVFSTATEGLGNITSTVSQGLNQVIGVPDPEELARMQADEITKSQRESVAHNEKQKITKECRESYIQEQHASTPVFGLNIVSGVTNLGSKVLNTGLDTLEGIGKKTMHILQENDPLLMNKRKLLGLEQDKPNLSEVLKEAKKDADQLENTLKELKLEKSREMLRFDLLFENNCGLVHLEALEILSKESTLKLQKLQDAVSGNALKELQETITEVKELMELEELEGESDGDYSAKDLNARLMSAIEDVELQINFDDIVMKWDKALEWLHITPTVDTNDAVQDTFAHGITALAETCALQICKLHKIGELLLVKDHHSTANEVDSIVQLCKQFNTHLNGLTNRFAATLTSYKSDMQADLEDVKKRRVSTLFAEMLVANQNIEKAFHLFLPILQIGAV